MRVGQSRGRLAGWALASASAAAMLSGAAALAFVADRPAPPLILDLGQRPALAPTIAAIAEAAPEVSSASPMTPIAPTHERDEISLPAPLPAAAAPPRIPAPPALLTPEASVTADVALPPPAAIPEAAATRPKPRPKRTADTARPRPADTPTAPPPKTTAAPAEAQAGATATRPGSTARAGGSDSPAAYARAVMRKVQATRKKPGAGRGTTLIGFALAQNGALVSVKVLQGSGSDSLDRIALDHIRRSAPFPPAPEGAARTFSFEFIGR